MAAPSVWSCWTAAGRCRSAATSSTRSPCSRSFERQLGGGGGLARALQADQHDDARLGALEVQAARLAERGDQLFVDDLDDLLGRG